MKKMGVIYLLTCSVSGKNYVGMTTLKVEHRWKQHINESKRGNPCPFYSAIRKYGEDSFALTVLEEAELDKLAEAERNWITKLNTVTDGYNLKSGGNGAQGTPPEKIRQKISESLKGRKLSDETKKKISDTLRGKHLTDETKSKIKESLALSSCKEARAKNRTGKKHTEEIKNLIGENIKKLWLVEEFREKMIAKRTGSNNSRALLNEEKVRQIRIEWRDADKSRKGIVAEFCKKYHLSLVSTHPSFLELLWVIRGNMLTFEHT